MRRFASAFAAFVAAVVLPLVLLGGCTRQGPKQAQPAQAGTAVAQDAVAQAVRRAAPAVVQVSALAPTGYVTAAGRPIAVRLVGSGFVVDARGAILTSLRLVTGARRVEVRSAPMDTPLPVQRIDLDAADGVAVLHVRPARPLKALPLARRPAAAGSYVLVLGRQGAAFGVVSAGARGMLVPGGGVRPLLQTDAPIHAGNVGGPLIDLSGHVVGMAMLQVAGGRRVAFAVPAQALSQTITRLSREAPRIGRSRNPHATSIWRHIPPVFKWSVRA